MKKLMNAFWMATVAASVVMAHSAHARSTQNRWTAPILRAQMDPNYTAVTITGGLVEIDYAARTAAVYLNHGTVCPANRLCAAMVLGPIVMKLPLVNVQKGTCNRTIWTAYNMNARLQIVDNSHNNCMMVRAVAETEVTLETVTTGRPGNKTRSYIEAGALRPTP